MKNHIHDFSGNYPRYDISLKYPNTVFLQCQLCTELEEYYILDNFEYGSPLIERFGLPTKPDTDNEGVKCELCKHFVHYPVPIQGYHIQGDYQATLMGECEFPKQGKSFVRKMDLGQCKLALGLARKVVKVSYLGVADVEPTLTEKILNQAISKLKR